MACPRFARTTEERIASGSKASTSISSTWRSELPRYRFELTFGGGIIGDHYPLVMACAETLHRPLSASEGSARRLIVEVTEGVLTENLTAALPFSMQGGVIRCKEGKHAGSRRRQDARDALKRPTRMDTCHLCR